jgi:hypothetical protein
MASLGRKTEQAAESGGGASPAVPAKHELVEIARKVRLAHAVQRAHQPALEIGKYPVNPGKKNMGGQFPNRFAGMLMLGELLVARQAVAEDGCTFFHNPLHKTANVWAGLVVISGALPHGALLERTERLQPDALRMPFIA